MTQTEYPDTKVASVSAEISGRTLTLETGRLAQQASGAVLATYGETVLLATVVGADEPREGIDFFPADGRLRGAHVRGRQDPRLVLQARRPAHRDARS